MELEYVKCALCGEDRTELLFKARDTLFAVPGEFYIVQCLGCGLAYLNPRPTRQAQASLYPQEYFDSIRSIEAPQSLPFVLRQLFDAYSRLVGGLLLEVESYPPGRVLDVGCGEGDFLLRFKERGWETYGVDPSPAAIAKAEKKGLKVLRGELKEADLPENYFDLVLMVLTIENMPNPLEVMQEVWRVLKDGGRVFIAAPALSSLAVKLFGQYCAEIEVPRHLHFFTRQTLTLLLKKAGLEVVAYRPTPRVLLRDVLLRLSRGRLKGLLDKVWVIRLLWTLWLPINVVAALLRVDLSNMHLIAEKKAGKSPAVS